MNMLPTVKLNNGVEIPCMGIGPGIIGFNNPRRRLNFPDNLIGKAERKVYNIITSRIDSHKYIKGVTNALNLGYRLIDYSFAYGSGKEIMTAIKNSGLKREEIFLTSRVSNRQQYDGTVRDEFFRGMERMGLEYIDLFMFHWPVTDHFVDTYKEMEKLYKEGYIRALGVANCHQHHLQAIMDNCEIMPAIDQFEIHPLFTQKPLVDFCHQHDIVVQAYTPLARNDDRLRSNPILGGGSTEVWQDHPAGNTALGCAA